MSLLLDTVLLEVSSHGEIEDFAGKRDIWSLLPMTMSHKDNIMINWKFITINEQWLFFFNQTFF